MWGWQGRRDSQIELSERSMPSFVICYCAWVRERSLNMMFMCTRILSIAKNTPSFKRSKKIEEKWLQNLESCFLLQVHCFFHTEAVLVNSESCASIASLLEAKSRAKKHDFFNAGNQTLFSDSIPAPATRLVLEAFSSFWNVLSDLVGWSQYT